MRFILKSWMIALRMVSKGMDTYTIYAFESRREQENGDWVFCDIFKSYTEATKWLEELEILHPELHYTTDFESLV